MAQFAEVNKNFSIQSETEREIDAQSVSSGNRICSLCAITFTRNSSFKRHVLKFHAGEEKELVLKKKLNFNCKNCDKTFSHSKILKQHEKSNCGHYSATIFLHRCVFCAFKDKKRSNVIVHYEDEHHVSIDSEEFIFKNKIEFENWKKEVERNGAFFRKTCCYSDPRNGFKRLKFLCNRSGYYESKGNNFRKLRNQGSLKIGGICPAEIDVKIYDDNRHVVNYVKSHCGHENDLQKLYLTREQRESIAIKIAAGMPYRVILDEARDSLQGDVELKRAHLITRKDLYNIARTFQLDNNVRSSVDNLSIEEWAKEMTERGCVLYHKLKGSFCNIHMDFLIDDSIVIIMNKCQLMILKNYAINCVCIDRTHFGNFDNMELISLLVNDEKRAYPCAFMVTNRVDAESVTLFYECVKERLGQNLETKVLMTDIDDLFYFSWLKIMGAPRFRFYCQWHTEIAWRDNLRKIKSSTIQLSVYNDLKVLLQTENQKEFEIALHKFTEQWSLKETYDFWLHFEEKFIQNTDQWAQYFKAHNNIILCSDLDTTHEEVSKIFIFRKNNSQLNLAITSLMNYATNKIIRNYQK